MCNELKKRTLKVAKVAHPENTFSLHLRKRGICIWFADTIWMHSTISDLSSKFLVDRKQVRRLAQKTLSALPNFYQFIYFYYISHVAHVFPKDSPQFFFSSLLGDKQAFAFAVNPNIWVIRLAICKRAFDLLFNVINLPIKGLWFFVTGIIKRQ